MTKKYAYAEGYQDALQELAEILDRDGIDAMIAYLRANATRPTNLDLSPYESPEGRDSK